MLTLNSHKKFPRLEEAAHASVADLEYAIPAAAIDAAFKILAVVFQFSAEVTTSVRVGVKLAGGDELVIYTPDAAETLTSKVVGLAQCPIVLTPGDTLVINTGDATSCEIVAFMEV